MEQNKIRLLRADEIECRIGTISENGLSLLLYKDARADMKILDEVFGTMGWQRQHILIGGNLYCIVSVWDEEKKQWIEKMDVGTESYTEKEKGQASDSFKRACVSVGIGRELYTGPFIWVSASKANIRKRQEGNKEKFYTYDKFSVQSISYNDKREITGLAIINQDGIVVYSLADRGKGTQRTNPQAKAADKPAAAGKVKTTTAADKAKAAEDADKTKTTAAAGKLKETEDAHAEAINKELARTGVALDTVLARYGVSSISEMSEATYKNAINSLKKTRSAA